MKHPHYIKHLRAGLKSDETGNKANSLIFLHRYGFNIPLTFLVTTEAYEKYMVEGAAILERLSHEITALPDINYAVRSSTSVEDSGEFSFAGQFQTLTNIRGTGNIIDAIQEVWESASLLNDNEYLKKTRIKTLKCGVVIQEMITSQFAGVSFSRNPVTNQNEVVIEAVEGAGEELVQKGVTPLRWRIRKDAVAEGNEHHHFYHIIKQVATDTLRLKRYYGSHIDIEWVYDGKKLYYLQLRQITGRKDLQIYSNKMAKEMLPGQTKPLVWSVNIPMVNGTWIGLLSEITGPLEVKPEDLAKSFYYQTYFNVVALGRIFSKFGMSADSLEYLMIRDDDSKPSFKPGISTLRHTFRIIRFIYGKLRFERTFLKEFGDLRKTYTGIEELFNKEYKTFSRDSFNMLYETLFTEGKRLAYLNIVTPILMSMYHKRLRKELAKRDVDYDKLDFREDFPLLIRLNPVTGMAIIRRQIDELPDSIKEQCRSVESLRSLKETRRIAAAYDDFIEEFGHLSDVGTDFSYPKWQEEPDKVFGMIMNSTGDEYDTGMYTFRELREKGIKIGSGLHRRYKKAGRFKVYREQISSFYIYGYGLFRKLFLKLGADLAGRGVLEKPDDIFYLTKQELNEITVNGSPAETHHYRELIAKRKQEMETTKDIVLPPVIYGEEAPVLGNDRVKNHSGIGTSSGSFSGNTRVVKGNNDFNEVQKGDVLLIPFSDVSWTPVLAKAGAIVSETGGMLSHSSIIAREMGIPALVSVPNACAFGTGLKVTVDGSNGILTIHDYE
ncbi:MAG: PEP/pyruvate-binding domain-containing protein [Bacteroidales bacterium]